MFWPQKVTDYVGDGSTIKPLPQLPITPTHTDYGLFILKYDM